MPINRKRVVLNEAGRKFLKELRLSNGLPEDFQKNYSTITKWEIGKNNPTLDIFVKYLSFFDINIDLFKDKNFIIEILPSAQEIATQKTTKIARDKHKLLIEDYRNGLTLEKISMKYGTTPSAIFYILKQYNIDMAKHRSGEKYSFPASDYIKYLINSGIKNDEVLPLIASLLFTDGCLYIHKKGPVTVYYGTDPTLHNIFADLVWFYFKIRPCSFMIRSGKVFCTKYINKNMAYKLLSLSPSFKKKPNSKETWKIFLKSENQPTLSFMKKYSNFIIKESIRLAMCADGCISVSNRKDRNTTMFTLILSCAHPNLVKEWADLFNRIGIKNSIVKGLSKTRIAGVKGIGDSILKFHELGGFIDDVKVCVHNSPLYGVEKQKILKNAVALLSKYKKINTIPINFYEFKSLI